MTSVDAGLTITWLDVRRLSPGRERLRRPCLDLEPGLKAVLAEVLCGIAGPTDGSNMAKKRERSAHGCKQGRLVA